MNVLIIGLGYAGIRFMRAFQRLEQTSNGDHSFDIAFVDKKPVQADIHRYHSTRTALAEFRPDIVVQSVNDVFRAEILRDLEGFPGFVICEKPFVCPGDDLVHAVRCVKASSGFCLDLVERYSEITSSLKELVAARNLRLLRANFYWGKDRINDHRPTCGVASEVIHALDLVQHISGSDAPFDLQAASGTRSDFSISGADVLDSVAITADLGGIAITGYASFVNITRKREIDLTFAAPSGTLIYAAMVFDTPTWDVDYLRVWERTPAGDHVLAELRTEPDPPEATFRGLRKLTRLVTEVAERVRYGREPAHPFADIKTAADLQRLLNAIENRAQTVAAVRYVLGSERQVFGDETDWERLG